MFGDPTLLTSEHNKTSDPRQSDHAPLAHADQATRRQGRNAAGFVALPNAVLLDTALSCVARVLYAVLLFHARQDGHCFPSLTTLCQDLGLGETTVRQYLHELSAAGLITQRRRGQGHTNLYILHAAMPEGSRAPVAAAEPEPPRTAPHVMAGPSDPVDPAGQEPQPGAADEERHDFADRFVISKLRVVPQDRTPGAGLAVPAAGHAGVGPAPQTTESHRGAQRERAAAPLPEAQRTPEDLRYQALVRPLTALTVEMGDGAPARANITRAYHLLVRAGLSCEEFLQHMAEARAITLASRDRIAKRCVGADHVARPNMMPYWFSVLTSLIERGPVRHQSGAAGIQGAPESREQPPVAYGTVPASAEASLPDEQGGQAGQQVSSAQATSGQRWSTQDEPNHQVIWQHVLAEVRRMVAPAVHVRCMTGVVRSEQGTELQIEVRDPAHVCWFETRVRRAIEAVLDDLGQAGLRVVFRSPRPSVH